MTEYRVRLLSYDEAPEHDAQFGTCELCFRTGTAENPTYTFEYTNTDTGEKHTGEVQGWYWSWGDYMTVDIDNVILFGDWLEDNHITVDTKELDYSGLQDLSYRWDDVYYGTQS